MRYRNVVFHVNKCIDGLYRECNSNCVFCFENTDKSMSNGKFISIAMLDRVIDFLKKTEDHLDNVYIAGGEPTLRKDLPDIVCRVSQIASEIHMTSNGNIKNASRLARKLRNNGLTHVGFSLHGGNAEQHEASTRTAGSFRMILDSIEAFWKVGIKVSLNCVVTSINIHSLSQIADFVAKRLPFVESLCFTHYHRQGEACENDNLYFDSWKESWSISSVIDKADTYPMQLYFRDFPLCIDRRIKDFSVNVEDIYVVLWDGDRFFFISERISPVRIDERCNGCEMDECSGDILYNVQSLSKYQIWESNGIE